METIKTNILNVEVSLFKNAKTSQPLKTVKLYDWLVSEENKELVSRLRTCKDADMKKRLKEQLPAITPSGTFTTRAAQNLVKHSGFICIDIDKKDNEKLEDFSKMKELIPTLNCVAYCGLSASGNGYFALIPIKETDRHKEHLESLKIDFAACNIMIDKACSDVSRLRFASYDETAYINTSAVPYDKIVDRTQKTHVKRQIICNSEKTRKQVNRLVNKIELLGIDITENYEDWFSIGCSIAKEFGETGRDIFHTVSQFYENYSYEETDKKFNDCLSVQQNDYTISTLFFYAKQHGIVLSDLRERFINTEKMENYEQIL